MKKYMKRVINGGHFIEMLSYSKLEEWKIEKNLIIKTFKSFVPIL